jgi:cell shape-determining protein MreC
MTPDGLAKRLEPSWRKGVRLIDGQATEVEEGLIQKSDYEHLLFTLGSLERENASLRKLLEARP